jgi:2-oxoglutarate dehydrogenase complex dehydrogenase (E1) component-like enzyme
MAAPPAKEMKAAMQKIAAKAAEKGVSLTEAELQRAVLDSIRALMIIRAYRIRGHLAADLDPLGHARRRRRIPNWIPPPTASPRPTWTGRSSSTTCWA